MSDVTQILQAIVQGTPAADGLLPLVYEAPQAGRAQDGQ
jgi:hypothetical protein